MDREDDGAEADERSEEAVAVLEVAVRFALSACCRRPAANRDGAAFRSCAEAGHAVLFRGISGSLSWDLTRAL